MSVPSNLIPTRVTQLPIAPVADENSLMMIVYQGNNYQIRVGDLLSVAGVPITRQVIAGTGMTGGGQLSSNVTLSIANGGVGSAQLASSGVTPGVYGTATDIPVFTVDSTGRVTAATTIPATVSGYVPDTRQVIAGTGLNGGGMLSTNVTLNANLSSATPQAGFQAGSAGVSTNISRADHKHPAVNLAVDDEVDGILGLNNGGTAKSLVPDEGAIIWCGADGLYVGPVGTAGQVLQSTGVGEYIWVNQSTLNVGQANNLNGGSANRVVYQTAAGVTGFIATPTVTNTFLQWDGAQIVWGALPGSGTVTSVNASGGTTGMTFTGGPITSSGTLTMSGTLIAANGGTGLSSVTAGDTLYYTSGDAYSKLAIGATNRIMTSSGTAPQWTDPASVTVGTATSSTTATNIAGGAAGSIPYQTGSNATALLAAGSGVLVGGSTPSYSTTPTLTGTNFSAIPNGALSNSAVTIGTTSISLGATSLTLGGLTSVDLTQNPTTALQAATKQYVDTLVSSGITYHSPVKYEVPVTTGNLTANYNQPGGAGVGVGATLTNAGALAAFAPDGPTAAPGDRVLIYNQTNAFENGVYTVTTVGDGSTPWVLTRATDADTYALKSPNGLGEGDAFFVTSGNTGAGETYVCNTSGTITFGTTNITFVQVSSSQVYSAGTGLTLTGTQFSLTTPVSAANGGVGQSSYTTGDMVYATGTTTLSKLAIGAASRIMTSSGAAPQWSDPSGITVGSATSATSATTATNVAGGAANQIIYNTGAGATSFIVAPTVTDTFLKWNGSAFAWAANPLGTVTSVDVSGGTTGLTTTGGPITSSGTITLAGTLAIANGGSGQTSAQNAMNAFAGAVTSGQYLRGNGTNVVMSAIQVADVPTLNQNTTGNAATATSATTATNLAGGVASNIPYQSGAGATSFLANGTAGQMLLSNGAAAPSWSNVSGGTF